MPERRLIPLIWRPAVFSTSPETFELDGSEHLTGGTTIGAGTLQIGNGTTGSISGNIADNANLAFARSNLTTTYSGLISGVGTLAQNGVGTLILSGTTSTFTGATTVNAGSLEVDGKLGTAASSVNVLSGATLAGQGTIGGSVIIQNGGILAPGPGSNALTMGPLFLSSSSVLSYKLSPGGAGLAATGLVSVVGNLTLQGTLNVASGANFILTNTVANQVNLVVTATGNPTQFWDGSSSTFTGTIHGGAGTWNPASNTDFY